MQITEGQKKALGIALGVIALVAIMGFVVWSIVKKIKEGYQQQNIENRDFSNERYEILPNKLERYIDSGVHENYEQVQPNSVYENYEQTAKGENDKSIFCTCGSLINKDCESTVSRVNSYNSGLTEFSKFKDKGWVDVMPYDEFISKPNYENSNSGWKDEMPYQIYEKN